MANYAFVTNLNGDGRRADDEPRHQRRPSSPVLTAMVAAILQRRRRGYCGSMRR